LLMRTEEPQEKSMPETQQKDINLIPASAEGVEKEEIKP
jgi:hypothetical protein